MNSRMDKYIQNDPKNTKRTEKNQKLYDEISDINPEIIDINNSNVFEITDKSFVQRSRTDYQKVRELNQLVNNPEKRRTPIETKPQRVERIYDINEILKKAKEDKSIQEEQKKRNLNTEYNILTKLDPNTIADTSGFDNESYKKIVNNLYEKEKPDDNLELFLDLLDNPKKESIDSKLSENQVFQEEVNPKIEYKEEQMKEEAPSNIETKEEATKEVIENKDIDDIYDSDENDDDDDNNGKRHFLIIVILIVLALFGVGGYLFLKYFGTL